MKIKVLAKTIILLLILAQVCQAEAQVMGSLYFNGIDNYVEVANNPLNTIDTGDFTFEVWIKGDEWAQNQHPVILSNRGTNPFGGGIVFFFHNQYAETPYKMLCFQINATNYRIPYNGTFNGSLLDNDCHHIAITRKGDVLSFYADGVLLATRTTTGSKSISFNGPLIIGKDRANNNTFNGTLSQIRIWNTLRTSAEIFDNKDISLQGTEPGLVAYWEMNEGSGQILVDKTNQFHGELGGDLFEATQDPSWSEDGCINELTSTSIVENPSIKIYPNPATDFINISKAAHVNMEFKLLNQTGSLILTGKMNAEVTNIDVSAYASGIYYLQIFNGESFFTQKVVKL